MILVRHPLLRDALPPLSVIPVPVDREQLTRRRFRAEAKDSTCFGFDLNHPLAHGDAVHETDTAVYVIEQQPEPLIEIPCHDIEEAGRIAWAIGNLHQPLEARPDGVRTVADPAVTALLDQLHLTGRQIHDRFTPFRSTHNHHH